MENQALSFIKKTKKGTKTIKNEVRVNKINDKYIIISKESKEFVVLGEDILLKNNNISSLGEMMDFFKKCKNSGTFEIDGNKFIVYQKSSDNNDNKKFVFNLKNKINYINNNTFSFLSKRKNEVEYNQDLLNNDLNLKNKKSKLSENKEKINTIYGIQYGISEKEMEEINNEVNNEMFEEINAEMNNINNINILNSNSFNVNNYINNNYINNNYINNNNINNYINNNYINNNYINNNINNNNINNYINNNYINNNINNNYINNNYINNNINNNYIIDSNSSDENDEIDNEIEDELIYSEEKVNTNDINSKIYIIKILGYEILFPYNPYTNQKLYMKKELQSLINESDALLESPTGTGKTLCLLCAVLSWNKKNEYTLENHNYDYEKDKSFDNEEQIDSDKKKKTKMNGKRIIYCTRTHSQINGAIKEIRKIKDLYDVNIAILASREKLCPNKKIIEKYNKIKNEHKKENEFQNEIYQSKNDKNDKKIKEEYDDIVNLCDICAKYKDKCKYYRNYKEKYKGNKINSLIDDGNIDKYPDIEDLKLSAKEKEFCPVYYMKDKIKSADIIFMSYNYIFNGFYRHNMELNSLIKDSVIIIDEAHNLPKVCEESLTRSIEFQDIIKAEDDCYAGLIEEEEEEIFDNEEENSSFNEDYDNDYNDNYYKNNDKNKIQSKHCKEEFFGGTITLISDIKKLILKYFQKKWEKLLNDKFTIEEGSKKIEYWIMSEKELFELFQFSKEQLDYLNEAAGYYKKN